MPVTLVSMFFHLNQERPKEFYYTHGRAVLTIDAPMVLFCDADTRPGLEAIRGDRPTAYVERRLADYDFYATLLPVVRANRVKRPSPDPRNTAEYFLLCIFKHYALMLASQRADFPSTHYMWLDLGCSHVLRDIPGAIYPILAAPRPKIACCYIHYRSPTELYPMESYLANGGQTGIAGGILTVEASYSQRLFTLFNSIFHELLFRGLGHSDEQIITYCYDKRPDLFSIYPGDYYSLATNYHSVREDLDCVRVNFVEPALAAGRQDIARLASTRLLVLVISGGDDPVYAQHKEIWRSYMHKTPGVNVYFVEAGVPRITEDTVVVAGTESWDGILKKTLEALKSLHSETYPYVLRTNLSSVWNFPRLLETIETRPREGVYDGIHGFHEESPYISGAGLLMSRDVVSCLLAHEDAALALDLIDDIAIGIALRTQGILCGPEIPRVDLLNPTTPIPTDGIHCRVKMVEGHSRSHEPHIMKSVLTAWGLH